MMLEFFVYYKEQCIKIKHGVNKCSLSVHPIDVININERLNEVYKKITKIGRAILISIMMVSTDIMIMITFYWH